jgi:hypothetical protein
MTNSVSVRELYIVGTTSGRKLVRILSISDAEGTSVRIEKLRAATIRWTRPETWLLGALAEQGMRKPRPEDADLIRIALKADLRRKRAVSSEDMDRGRPSFGGQGRF